MATIKTKITDEVQSQFTSMIDMVFLLVIFFIVQPFKAPEMRMPAELPKDAPAIPQENPIPPVVLRVISLGGTRGAWVVDQGRPISDFKELPGRILAAAGGNTETAITIEPDMRVKFDYVLRALDACSIAQMTKVGFAKPPVSTPNG